MKRAITQIFTLLLLITLAVPAFAGKVLAEIEYFYSDDGTLIPSDIPTDGIIWRM
jgi:hypothetical protein